MDTSKWLLCAGHCAQGRMEERSLDSIIHSWVFSLAQGALAGVLTCTRFIWRQWASRTHILKILTNPAWFGFRKRHWFKWGIFFFSSQGYVCEILGYKAWARCHTFYSFMHSPAAAPCVTLLSYPNCKIKDYLNTIGYVKEITWRVRADFSVLVFLFQLSGQFLFPLAWNPLDGTREYYI